MRAFAAAASLLVSPHAPTPVVAPPALTAPALPGRALPHLTSPRADAAAPVLAVPAVAPVLPVPAVPQGWQAVPAALGAAVLAAPKGPASAVQVASPALDAVFDGKVGPLEERHGAGLLVVDLKSSTKLYQEIGNRKARRVVDGALDMAEHAAKETGGRVARRLGDGLLIVFPDRRGAAEAEAAIQARVPEVRARLGRPELALHSAVDSGRVVEDRSGGKFDVYGQAVERALKSAAGAEPDARAAVPGNDSWRQPEFSTVRFERRATLFADLEDWPRNYDGYGRRRAIATIKAFHSYAAAVVARHGGTMVKTSGEAVMVTFADAASAVKAAAELQSRIAELKDATPLGALVRARVGVSYGRVIREERLESTDYFGNTVNAAARLMKLAGGGGVLLSASVLHDPAAKAYLEAGRVTREAHALKGFELPLETLRVDPALLTPPPVKPLTPALRRIADAVMTSLPARP